MPEPQIDTGYPPGTYPSAGRFGYPAGSAVLDPLGAGSYPTPGTSPCSTPTGYPAGAPSGDVLSEPFNNLTAWTVTGAPTIVAGRTGTAAQFTWTSGADKADYLIPSGSQSDTITIGFAWRPNPDTTHARPFMRLMSDSGATDHANLWLNTDGSLEYRVTPTAKYRSAAGLFVANAWYYIEVQTKMHDTTGTIIIRVNGTELTNQTGIDTKAGGTKTVWDTVRLGPPTGFNGSDLYDDLYIATGATAAFKGPITIP